jgi:hypothetical protein
MKPEAGGIASGLGHRLLKGIHTSPDLVRTTRQGVAYFSTGVLDIQVRSQLAEAMDGE